jgi:hypothetical protein
VYAGHKVLVEVGSNRALIVGHGQGIVGEQFRPIPIHLLNIIIIITLINYSNIKLCFKTENLSL